MSPCCVRSWRCPVWSQPAPSAPQGAGGAWGGRRGVRQGREEGAASLAATGHSLCVSDLPKVGFGAFSEAGR